MLSESPVADNAEKLYNRELRSVPKPSPEIGIDVDNTVIKNAVDMETSTSINIGEIQSFTTISQSRDQLYTMLDSMSEDPIISAALEIYTEDATEANNDGRIVWVESSNSEVQKHVDYLLRTLNVEKNIYKWVYSLCKYGDLYLRLYRESEVQDDLFADKPKALNEDVKLKLFHTNDKFIHYVEMVPNPAELFELTKFGKSYAYIEAPLSFSSAHSYKTSDGLFYQTRYKFKKTDVNLYGATEYVHACLEDNASRVPETIDIFAADSDYEADRSALSYKVRRGQSVLYSSFKAWRNKSLLENSVLLNRITKSSIVRVVSVQVGDMPKEQVQAHLLNIKQLVEQKVALNTNNAMVEYTNPGPIENTIYIPQRGETGTLSIQQIGDDVDVKSLADLEYFKDQFYSGLRIPKQYLGDTDDATGFNGGTSLTLVSSRYSKTVKRIQSAICQMIKDLINIFLIDSELESYINKFEIKMLTPTTQEELDRISNYANKVGLARDVLDILDLQDPAAKLSVAKDLLTEIINDPDILSVIDTEIKNLQPEEEVEEEEFEEEPEDDLSFDDGEGEFTPPTSDQPDLNQAIVSEQPDTDSEEPQMDEGSFEQEFEEPNFNEERSYSDLPNMADLGINFADANSEI